jgi:hypothetical protein
MRSTHSVFAIRSGPTPLDDENTTLRRNESSRHRYVEYRARLGQGQVLGTLGFINSLRIQIPGRLGACESCTPHQPRSVHQGVGGEWGVPIMYSRH